MDSHKPILRRNQPLPAVMDTTTKVVAGQSLSLQALAHKINNGLPVQASSRVIETYFRNLDLVDAEHLAENYQNTVDKVEEANRRLEESDKKKREAEKKEYNDIKAQIAKLSEPAPTP
ncbi:MAG: hypothetical protein [Microvirus sp.]|nr:MAG: hypothetical protein [Microvirus sp.]